MTEIVEAVSEEQLDHIRNLFREYQAQLPPPFRAPSQQAVPGVYAPPKGKLLLATVAGQPVGCVGLRPFPLEAACEMKHLYVRPTFRGGNVGRALAVQIIDAARALGYTRLRLDTHPPTMQAALTMYKELGFREVGPGPVVPVNGLLYMELLLTTT